MKMGSIPIPSSSVQAQLKSGVKPSKGDSGKSETLKEFTIDRRTLSNSSMETILKEAEKCILLCANCHREHHNPECDIEAVKVFVNNTPYKESREVKTGTDCKVCGTNFKKITGKIYCSKSCREKDKK